MTYSEITITFNEDLVLNNAIGFTVSSTSLPVFIAYLGFRWVNLRSASGQVTIGNPTGIAGERSAINFVQAFSLDWISTGLYTISRLANVVTIKCVNPNLNFSNPYTIDDYLASPPSYNNNVTFDINNFNGNPFNIESVNFSETSTVPCQNVKVNVSTSTLIKNVISPVNESNVNDTNFGFDWLRGQTFTLSIEDYDGNIINQTVETPSILNPNYFDLQINNSPNGATVVINNGLVPSGFFLLELQYSLDNSTWQDSNTFSGLVADNYTVYIKDQLGCSTSLNFAIDENGIQSPFFYISKANSIRFANRIEWGDAANYKNDENTLSCEVRDKLPYMEVQQFQTADVITTQFKSNYSSNTAIVIRENGTEAVVPVVKKTSFIGNKDSRDARKYDLGGGKTGIYFTTGNIYDFDTGTDTGEDHYLNGGLPIWAKAGNYVKVDTEWFLIEDFVYDDEKNSEVIIISNNYSGNDVPVVVGTIYNIYDFEVYEFTIDMVDFINEEIQVRIEALDQNFTNITHLSEKIDVKVRHAECLEIKYWNDDNSDIYYASEIKHLIRIPFTKIIDASDEDSENNKTDSNTVLISSEIYEGSEITFEPTTLEIMRKLRIALNCRNLFIDGVGYVINGNIDSDQKDDSNLYVVKAKLIKTGGAFTSQSEGLSDFNANDVEIPGLISVGGNGMLRY